MSEHSTCRVTTGARIERMVESALHRGRIEIFINNGLVSCSKAVEVNDAVATLGWGTNA